MYTKLLALLVLTSSLLSLGSAVKSIRQAGCPPENSDFVAANPQCAGNPGLNAQFEDTLQYLVCNATCGPPYLAGIRRCFGYQLLADYYEGHCIVNANGRPCYSFYNNSEFDTSVFDPEAALQICDSSIRSNTCTNQCREQLITGSMRLGSCVNVLANSSYFRSFNYELLPLVSYQLWSSCGVPTPGMDGGPPTSGPTSSGPTSSGIPTASEVSGVLTSIMLLCTLIAKVLQ